MWSRFKQILVAPLPLPRWVPTRVGVTRRMEVWAGPMMMFAGTCSISLAAMAFPIYRKTQINIFLAIIAVYAGVGLVSCFLGINMTRHQLLLRRRRRSGACVHCGYDLRATPERCPECGKVPAASERAIMRTETPLGNEP